MFQRFKRGSCLVLLSILFGLTGCLKKPHYTPRPLKPLTKEMSDFVQTKKDVTLMAKKLTPEECAEIFDGRELPKEIVPIQLSLANNGFKTLLLLPENISLSCVDKAIVENMFQYNGRARVIAGFASGICIVPLVWAPASLFVIMSCNLAVVTALYVVLAVASPILAIVAISAAITTLCRMDYINSMNASIVQDMHEKNLCENLAIAVGETKNKLIFAQAYNCKSAFALTLTGNNQEKLTFDVDLDQKAELNK